MIMLDKTPGFKIVSWIEACDVAIQNKDPDNHRRRRARHDSEVIEVVKGLDLMFAPRHAEHGDCSLQTHSHTQVCGTVSNLSI